MVLMVTWLWILNISCEGGSFCRIVFGRFWTTKGALAESLFKLYSPIQVSIVYTLSFDLNTQNIHSQIEIYLYKTIFRAGLKFLTHIDLCVLSLYYERHWILIYECDPTFISIVM
jgi:hypothetical protein